jgi:non-ribosomal peptide synthase protein (TIGR01720 family)
MALAGGVSIRFPQPQGYAYQAESIMSPDGHCRPFDEEAAGTVAGSGVGIVVLKRLREAERDGDRIEAVILGSAINNDGANKVGYTAPGVEGQAAVIRAALASGGVEPETVTAIEAHGTGTKLGDPIEVAALKEAYGSREGARCALGSVKGNVGHLDAAAGVTGLIKATLELQHGELVGMPHFARPGAKLGLEESRFYVPRGVERWERKGGRRRIGVSSFGIGGTNAHVVLEEAPVRGDEEERAGREIQVLALSAKTATALERATEQMAGYLEKNPEANLADVAYTLQVGRTAHGYRRTALCRSVAEAARALRTMDPDKVRSGAVGAAAPRIVFLFPGQGSQRAEMGRALHATEAVFRAVLDECAEKLKPLLDGVDIREAIFHPNSANPKHLDETWLAQPGIFAIEYALARFLMSFGITPSAMLGHSIGEYVAACLAGVMTLDDALRLVAARGALMQRMPRGAMLATGCGEDRARALANGRASVAAVNAEMACVLSGDESAIADIERTLEGEGIASRRLRTSHAYHSALMDGALDEMAREAAQIELQAPAIPYVSNVTGGWISREDAANPSYWAQHLRSTVRFGDGLRALLEDGSDIFVEVGCGTALSSLARRESHLRAGTVSCFAALPADVGLSEIEAFQSAIAGLWIAGAAIDWEAFHRGENRNRVSVPTYPFERERYFVEPDATPHAATYTSRKTIGDWFYAPTWERSMRPNRRVPARAGNAVLFIGGAGIKSDFCHKLNPVAIVIPGTRFVRRSERLWEIRKDSLDDVVELLKLLRSSGIVFDSVVHAWSVDADLPEQGYFSVVRLLQALTREDPSESARITIVASGACAVMDGDPVSPAAAMTAAATAVAAREYPGRSCQFIDIQPEALAKGNGKLAENLVELIRDDAADQARALRGGDVWKAAYRRVSVDSANPRLREESVVLITGGHGGAGLALAEYLVKKYRAKIALLSRSGGSGAAGKRIAEIEKSGGRLFSVQADVANADELRAAIAATEARFGQINAVVHAAGLAGGGLIANQTIERIEEVLAPKVRGAELLFEAFRERDLDFFALFSSQRAIVPMPGRIDYCSANAYLDAFAVANAPQSRFPLISIGWDSWRKGGMGEKHRGAFESEMAFAMSSEEAIECFERAVRGGYPHVIVSTRELEAVIERSREVTVGDIAEEIGKRTDEAERHARPALATPYVAPRNNTEEALCGIWQTLLGISRVGVMDNFFDLGGDSVVSIQMIGRAAQRGIRVTTKQIFERQTIAGLAAACQDAIATVAEQGIVTGTAPLNPIQAWFFEKSFPGMHHFNQAVLLQTQVSLRAVSVEAAVNFLCMHHDALRLRFREGPEGIRADYAAAPEPGIVRGVDFSTMGDAELPNQIRACCDEAHRSLDLKEGPIMRVLWIDCGTSRPARCFIAIHHLAVDLISWRTLLEDFQNFLKQIASGAAPRTTAKTTPFKSWAERLKLSAESGYFRDEIPHWESVAARGTAELFRRSEANAAEAGSFLCSLGSDETESFLRGAGGAAGAQPNAVLLAALGAALGGWAGASEIVVDIEGAGREPLFDDIDLSRTTGWFTSIYPVVIPGIRAGSITKRVQAVREELKLTPRGGIGYGALQFLDTESRDRGPRARDAQICFLYAGEASLLASDSAIFRNAQEDCGNQFSPEAPLRYQLVIEAAVRDGHMQVSWNYNSLVLDSATVEGLAGELIHELRRFTDESRAARNRASAMGAADFNWNESDLSEIEAAIARAAGS